MSQTIEKNQELRQRRAYMAPALAKREKLARLAALATSGSAVIVDGTG